MSETAKARPRLSPFCHGDGLDIGYGGDPIVPWAITMDTANPYTNVGDHPQNLHGDCRFLPFKDWTLNFVYSSHLIEDFTWEEQRKILREWVRVIRPNGYLVLYQPDQQAYLASCRQRGEGDNPNHKEQDFSLQTFKANALRDIPFLLAHEFNEPDEGAGYSWGLVVRVNFRQG